MVGGQAPATTSIIRYNQRAVPVLSYASRLASPPKSVDIPNLSGWGVHKILRLPANSMSRELCHSVSFCSAVDPTPLDSYCKACMYRFAHSEKDYLLSLAENVQKFVGEDLALKDCNPTWWKHVDLPSGGLSEPPLLQGLLDVLNHQDAFAWIGSLSNDPIYSGLSLPVPSVPKAFKV